MEWYLVIAIKIAINIRRIWSGLYIEDDIIQTWSLCNQNKVLMCIWSKYNQSFCSTKASWQHKIIRFFFFFSLIFFCPCCAHVFFGSWHLRMTDEKGKCSWIIGESINGPSTTSEKTSNSSISSPPTLPMHAWSGEIKWPMACFQ